MDEVGEHVLIVVDCSIDSWKRVGDLAEDVPPRSRCSLSHVLEAVGAVQSALSLFHADNHVSLIAAGSSVRPVDSVQELAQFATQEHVSIAKALCVALCVANRVLKDDGKSQGLKTRLLLLTATQVPPYDAVTSMNCAFAAQKLGFVLDILDYTQSTSPTLRQLVHHTDGWYLSLAPKDGRQGALAHSVLYFFVCPPEKREHMSGPPAVPTDMRSVCFCHKELQSMGFVCSVCLSVFCEKEKPTTKCPTCSHRIMTQFTSIKRNAG